MLWKECHKYIIKSSQCSTSALKTTRICKQLLDWQKEKQLMQNKSKRNIQWMILLLQLQSSLLRVCGVIDLKDKTLQSALSSPSTHRHQIPSNGNKDLAGIPWEWRSYPVAAPAQDWMGLFFLETMARMVLGCLGLPSWQVLYLFNLLHLKANSFIYKLINFTLYYKIDGHWGCTTVSGICAN